MEKKVVIVLLLICLCLTGCGKSKTETLEQNIKKIELTGNLVTHKAYFHNVIEYDKKKGTGALGLLEKDRKLFAEYTGTIKLGIDLTKVKIDVNGNQINVTVHKAMIIGEPNVDKNDFNSDNFIESKDGFIKNKLSIEDSSEAFNEAQKNMKEAAANNNELLSVAQKRAKVILEENIKQFSNLSEDKYTINWEYEY